MDGRILDDFIKLFVALVLLCLFVCIGFFIGREYVLSLKDRSDTHTHIHMYYSGKGVEKSSNDEKMYVDYKDEDLDCLSRNIYFEAGNQSSIGKLAVGLVVMNRVASKKYPDTICGVVNQRSQFSWVDDGKSDVPKNDNAWKVSQNLSRDILEGKANFINFDDVMHYHADYVSPSWSKRMQQVAQIDQHIFYE